MDLGVAVRHAVSRIATGGMAAGPLTITFAGTIEKQGEGPRRRRLGPVSVNREVAAPFLKALEIGDEDAAAEEFEYAFALSYGVGDLRDYRCKPAGDCFSRLDERLATTDQLGSVRGEGNCPASPLLLSLRTLLLPTTTTTAAVVLFMASCISIWNCGQLDDRLGSAGRLTRMSSATLALHAEQNPNVSSADLVISRTAVFKLASSDAAPPTSKNGSGQRLSPRSGHPDPRSELSGLSRYLVRIKPYDLSVLVPPSG